jgi:hypothetical protein
MIAVVKNPTIVITVVKFALVGQKSVFRETERKYRLQRNPRICTTDHDNYFIC